MFHQIRNFLCLLTTAFIALALLQTKATAGGNTLTGKLVAQANPAITTNVAGNDSDGTAKSNSPGTVVIESDSLANATGNILRFDATATHNMGNPVEFVGVDVTTTSPNSGSATQSTFSTTAAGSTASAVFSLPVDQVAFGAAAQTFTISLSSYPDLKAGSGGPLGISNCAGAKVEGFPCGTATLNVTVNPLTTAPVVAPVAVVAPTPAPKPKPTATKTSAQIDNFNQNRNRNILSNQPDLSIQLTKRGKTNSTLPVAFTAQGTPEQLNINFESSLHRLMSRNSILSYDETKKSRNPIATIANTSRYNVWVRGALNRSNTGGQRQNFSIFHLGADYAVNDGFVFGVLAQVDFAREQDTTGAFTSGVGWLAGPYVVARLGERFYFDGQVALGRSKNRISPTGTYVDNFSASRLLVNARLSGDFNYHRWKIAPQLAVKYLRETQASYVDNLNVTIPSQTSELGQLTFGPKLSTDVKLGDGSVLTPTVGLTGIWNFKDSGVRDLTTGLRQPNTGRTLYGRFDAGLALATPDGLNVEINGFYDGLGARNYRAYGASAKIRIQF